MADRLERIEDKIDGLRSSVSVISTNQQHITRSLKNITDETQQNSKFRFQAKAILSAFGLIISFTSYINLSQCQGKSPSHLPGISTSDSKLQSGSGKSQSRGS